MLNASSNVTTSGASNPTLLVKIFSAERLASFLFFLALWLFWGVRYADYLFAAQENGIFLYRLEFLTRWLDVPDGLLCYISSFIIQFFYYPLVGGALLACLGVLVQVLCARLLGGTGVRYALSFIPTCLITISATWPAYFVFIPFNLPLIFSEPIGLFFVFAAFRIYRRIKTYRLRLIFAFLWVAIGYRFIACWSTVSVLLFAVEESTRRLEGGKFERGNMTRALWLVLIAILIPLVLQRFWLFPRLKFHNVFTCGIIEDVRYDRDSLTAFFSYRFAQAVPLFILTCYFLTRLFPRRVDSNTLLRKMERAERRRLERKAEKERQKGVQRVERKDLHDETPQERQTRFFNEGRRQEVKLMFELVFLLCVVSFFLSYHTRAFFDSLKAVRAMDSANWEEVLKIDASNSHPIPLMVGMRNLALYKTGRFAEEAFLRPISGESTLTVTVEDNARALSGNFFAKLKMKLFSMKTSTERSAYRSLCELIFCHWGLTNVGARVAMDNLVAIEGRSVSFLKTLALAAAVNGEKELSRKYLRELSQTLFYRNYAKAGMAFLDSQVFFTDVRDSHSDEEYDKALKSAREEYVGLSFEEASKRYGIEKSAIESYARLVFNIREERPERNRITKKAYPNATFLMDVVFPDEYKFSSLKRKELILLATLLQKKGDLFLEHIDDYLKLKGCEKGGAPRAIEEGYATWRYSKFGNDWRKCDYQFRQETIELMGLFIQYTQKFGASGVAVQATLRESFSGNYWGYAIDESTFRTY